MKIMFTDGARSLKKIFLVVIGYKKLLDLAPQHKTIFFFES